MPVTNRNFNHFPSFIITPSLLDIIPAKKQESKISLLTRDSRFRGNDGKEPLEYGKRAAGMTVKSAEMAAKSTGMTKIFEFKQYLLFF
jgi:hypothetical protein